MVWLEILKALNSGFGTGSGDGGELTLLLLNLSLYASIGASMYAFFRILRPHKDILITGFLAFSVFILSVIIALWDIVVSLAMFGKSNAGDELIDIITKTHDIRMLYIEGIILCAFAASIFIAYSLIGRRKEGDSKRKHIALRLFENNALEYCCIAVLLFICTLGLCDVPLPAFFSRSVWFSLFVYLGYGVVGKCVLSVFIIITSPLLGKSGSGNIKAPEWLDVHSWLRSWLRKRAFARAYMVLLPVAIITAAAFPVLKGEIFVNEFKTPSTADEARSQMRELYHTVVRVENPQIVYIINAFWPDGSDLWVVAAGDVYTMLCKAAQQDTQTYFSGTGTAFEGRYAHRDDWEQFRAVEALAADNPNLNIPPVSNYYLNFREGPDYTDLYALLIVGSPFLLLFIYALFAAAFPGASLEMQRLRRGMPELERQLYRLKRELEDRQIIYDGKGFCGGVTITAGFFVDEGVSMRIIPVKDIVLVRERGWMQAYIVLAGRSHRVWLDASGVAALKKQIAIYQNKT